MHLSATGIVQQYDDGLITDDEFRNKLIIWLTEASESELDILRCELLDGFEASSD